jgi:RHS repeat-associated protein
MRNELTYSQEYSLSANKYLYNSKELQDDKMISEALNWFDYGARFYDPQIGRFSTQDRFAEKYFDFTPYQYGANNPILFIDVNGIA